MDKVAPRREKLRRDNDEPMMQTSSTDRANKEPMRAKPLRDTADPKRAKLRKDSELPKLEQSMTEKALPTRTKLRRAKDAPK